MKPNQELALWAASFFLAVVVTALADPAGTGFAFQGQLKDRGVPANGMYDLIFRLYDGASGGSPIGSSITVNDWPVTNGLFTISLDFGANPFDGSARWLQVEVRSGGTSGAYATLTPRQPLTATPYALYALNGPGESGPWDASGANIHNTNTGNVGIGTDSPAAPLHVIGDIRSDGPIGVAAHNPNNPGAVAALGWFNDVARIRIGGNGAGAGGGLDIQKTGDRSLMRIYDSGDAWFRGGLDISGGALFRTGQVGIGTAEPDASLHVAGDGVEAAVRISNGGGAACADISNTGLMVSDVCGTGRAAGFYGVTSNTLITVQNDGSGKAATFAGDVAFNAGKVGIGTPNPSQKLHIDGGSDVSLGGGGYTVIGPTNGQNMAIDNNEIMSRNNGSPATLFLNHDGGSVAIGGNAPNARLGLGTALPTERLDLGGGNIAMGYEVVHNLTDLSSTYVGVTCPSGKMVISGGCNCGNGDAVEEFGPWFYAETSGWECYCQGNAISATAICANIR